jgi:predicted cation transporter
MGSKIRILMVLVSLLCLPLRALAVEHNFPAGSLIIPMDITNQTLTGAYWKHTA